MANVSIIDIEVRDQAFQALKKQFDDFQAAAAATPAMFGAMAGQVRGLGTAIVAAEATMGGLTANTQLALSRQRALTHQAVASKGAMAALSAGGDQLAAKISAATKDLRSWASLGNPFEKFFGPGGLKNILKSVGQASLLSGLAGVGSLFGLERLGASVGGQRRSALGLGVSTGEQNAFRINYGRYTDAEGMLGRVADAKNDVNKQRDFSALGITPQQVQSLDPADLSRMVIERTRTMARGHGDNATLGSYADAMGMTNFSSMDDIRRYMRTSDGEMQGSSQGYDRDKSDLSLSDRTSKAWQDLDTQLTRAAAKIENVFVEALAPLAPGLEKLSDAVAASLKTLLSNPHMQEWMDQLGAGLQSLAKYVGSEAFQEKVKGFVDDLALMVAGLEKAVHWLADKFGPGDAALPAGAPGAALQKDGQPSSVLTRNFPGLIGPPKLLGAEAEKNRRESWDFWKSKGLSDEAAAAKVGNEAGENGFDPSVRGDGGLAGGLKQWHQERRDAILKATGIDVWNAPHGKQLEAAYAEDRLGLDVGAGRAWQNLHQPRSIGGAVSTLVQDDERSKYQGRDIGVRTRLAEDAYRAYHGMGASTPSTREPHDWTVGEAMKKLLQGRNPDQPWVTHLGPHAGQEPSGYDAPRPAPSDRQRGIGPMPYPDIFGSADTNALRAGVRQALASRTKPADDIAGTPPAPGYVPANGNTRLASNSRVTIYNQTGGNAVVIAGQTAAVA